MNAILSNAEGIFWLVWGFLNLLAVVIYIIKDAKDVSS